MPGVNRLLNFSRHKAIALSCGLAVIAIGATVLVGWLTGSRALTAVMPGLIPMAPNTAIAFALLGTALCVLGGGRSLSRAVVRACVFLTLAMIVPRIIEFALGIDFKVDAWVIEVPHEELSGTPVGRMAFFTAICFLFASIVLFALALSARRRTVEALAGVTSVTLTSIAVIFFFGYLIGSPLFSAGPTIPMALNTSFSFLLLGAGLISSTFDKRLPSHPPSELDSKMIRMHRLITTGFGLAFSTVLVASILAYENSVRFAENSELVSHSYQLLAESEDLVSTLKDAETGARGFVLTGNPDFLEPYEVARGRIGEQLLALKHLEKHHPHQQSRIDGLAPLMEMKIRSATELMDIFGLNGPTAAQKLVASEEWKTAMDSIGTFVSELQEEERSLLELSLLQQESGLSRSITFFSLLTILVIILFTALYLVIERGLTERQRAEVALREAAREIEDLYHNAPCGYHSLDATGTFVQINNTELSWLGWSRDEVVGKMRFLDFLTAAGTELFKRSFLKFMATGSIKDLEFEMKRRDGSTFWVLLSATALIDDRGNFIRSRSTMFDITDKHHALEELHLQTNLYETLLKTQSNLGQGVIMTEADRIIFVNEAFCRITGYPEVEIMALGSIFELIPAQKRDGGRERVTDFLRGGNGRQ